VSRLSSFVEQHSVARARDAVLSAFGAADGGAARRPGRPAAVKGLVAGGKLKLTRLRKKPPVQLCPVPGCQNRAAPVFGMVCAQHKNISKDQIRKYREARR